MKSPSSQASEAKDPGVNTQQPPNESVSKASTNLKASSKRRKNRRSGKSKPKRNLKDERVSLALDLTDVSVASYGNMGVAA
jgi:hypothetical protein